MGFLSRGEGSRPGPSQGSLGLAAGWGQGWGGGEMGGSWLLSQALGVQETRDRVPTCVLNLRPWLSWLVVFKNSFLGQDLLIYVSGFYLFFF